MKNAAGKIRGQLEQQIRRRLLQAIFEQRLPPGARLTEEVLAETFNVSRTVIRQVIARLAQDGILVKNTSGATHVASPSKVEAKQMLAVRRMIEPEIVKYLANQANNLSFADLLVHIESEARARRAEDGGTLVRLTGEFHLLLARMTGNAVLARLMTELQALICLAILLYATGNDACHEDEHRRMVDAIKAGDGSAAAVLMIHHLDHIEADLNLEESTRPGFEIGAALNWLSGGG
ncbi:GntR family transcriptional regulator [Bradyrhizobium prioriisuperbiae]|uniref:GntR family transcriptional regulator n=1 Tax=Bradyrhizobium prioriisuperbiae TaxID=2854389 RepID=UPI0028EEB04E|nr:GntR family transcriptional regulator [Bradyrhizobium prioritasuperba]